MTATILFFCIAFIIGMILSAVLHVTLERVAFWQNNFLASSAAICLASVFSALPVAYYFFDASQFAGEINFLKFALPLTCSLIVLASVCFNNIYITSLGLLLACTLGVGLSDITISFYAGWPQWLNTVCTIAGYWLFAWGFYCISGLTPLPQAQGIFPAIGLVIIAVIGHAPLAFGVSAAAIFGVFAIAYVRGQIQPVSHASAPLLGYIVGWLGLISYPEFLFPCFAIFMMYYFAELAVALFRRITTIKNFSELPYNSVIYQTFEQSSSPELVSRVLWHTGILLVLLGVFQINSPNISSFPIFALFVCFWQQYRLYNWNNPDKTFKENYNDAVKSIKQALTPIIDRHNKKQDDK